jgi:large subunit ribosomal protein L3
MFDTNGKVFPVTALSVGPVVVTQIKTKETDGYSAIQVGYGVRREKNINKAQKKKGFFKVIKEFRVPDVSAYKIGDSIDPTLFIDGDTVVVSGISKGKGFQGVVKRHGFAGGPRTHGQKHSEREPGSIGGGLRNRVPKGMRMAGRMGGDRITVRNLKVVGVDVENNQLLIKGAIPGRRGTLVEVIG